MSVRRTAQPRHQPLAEKPTDTTRLRKVLDVGKFVTYTPSPITISESNDEPEFVKELTEMLEQVQAKNGGGMIEMLKYIPPTPEVSEEISGTDHYISISNTKEPFKFRVTQITTRESKGFATQEDLIVHLLTLLKDQYGMNFLTVYIRLRTAQM